MKPLNPQVVAARERIKANNEQVQQKLNDPALTQETLEEVKGLNETIKKDTDFVQAFEEERRKAGEIEATKAIDETEGQNGDSLSVVKHLFPNGIQLAGMTPSGFGTFEKGSVYHDGMGSEEIPESAFKAAREREYAVAFRSYLRKGVHKMGSSELKTLQEAADGSGGYLVPEDFQQRLLQKDPTPTRVQDNVTQMTTGRDATILPKVNYTTDDLYTTGIRATFTGEVPASSTTARVTEPAFGQFRVPIYTAMLSMPLTNNLVEDSNFGLQQWAEDKFAETISLLKENMILNGSGVGQPSGILMAPGTTGQPAVVPMGNAINAAGIVKMAWSVPEQYDAFLKWVMNKTNTGQQIAGIQDATGRFMWQSYVEGSLRDSAGGSQGNIKDRTLEGYPVLFQGFMPNTGANNYPIIFGDLRGYYLVNRVGFSVQVLRELYAETNQILLLGRVRFGGGVGEEWRIKVGQQA